MLYSGCEVLTKRVDIEKSPLRRARCDGDFFFAYRLILCFPKSAVFVSPKCHSVPQKWRFCMAKVPLCFDGMATEGDGIEKCDYA